jgi:hypothetical protein
MGNKPLSLLTFANMLCDWGYTKKEAPLLFVQAYVWVSEVGLGTADKRNMAVPTELPGSVGNVCTAISTTCLPLPHVSYPKY